jgi:hypothetical protein
VLFRGIASRRNINITLAELIREAQPYQRLIVLFRDPVSRYYSVSDSTGQATHRNAGQYMWPVSIQ